MACGSCSLCGLHFSGLLCLKLYDIPVRKWLKRMIGQSAT